MKTNYITFRSVTLAQRGERTLRQGGIDCALQRTPRWMEERGCGYCLRIRPGDTLDSLERLRANSIHFSKIYTRKDNGSVEELMV
jgi:hypothetical protein